MYVKNSYIFMKKKAKKLMTNLGPGKHEYHFNPERWTKIKMYNCFRKICFYNKVTF